MPRDGTITVARGFNTFNKKTAAPQVTYHNAAFDRDHHARAVVTICGANFKSEDDMAKALGAAACPTKGTDSDRAPIVKIEFMSCAFLDITTLRRLKALFPQLKDVEVHDCAAFPYHLFAAKPDPPAENFLPALKSPYLHQRSKNSLESSPSAASTSRSTSLYGKDHSEPTQRMCPPEPLNRSYTHETRQERGDKDQNMRIWQMARFAAGEKNPLELPPRPDRLSSSFHQSRGLMCNKCRVPPQVVLNNRFNHGFDPTEPARLKHPKSAKEEDQPVFSQGFLRSVCEELKAGRTSGPAALKIRRLVAEISCR
ncbi:uncharacterized protein MYCGRDRAFT_93584 [Zymoseptoria tritici IPO323]|uniref:Uncharacterized protein n=1 Tax=Zymoseptoria tritici (strain CBS 115943 / IPO323) TaxID=336722 RepID=F9XBI9_ZYMTI|nr:uncharacterized protein MYCGRDRAFT_93584 [Zymoseptoria tritici IPO323]EGP87375.1 hypothetical protein MYCGRDRAFT_93584 [Zymoseptoria tritici IPO323]